MAASRSPSAVYMLDGDLSSVSEADLKSRYDEATAVAVRNRRLAAHEVGSMADMLSSAEDAGFGRETRESMLRMVLDRTRDLPIDPPPCEPLSLLATNADAGIPDRGLTRTGRFDFRPGDQVRLHLRATTPESLNDMAATVTERVDPAHGRCAVSVQRGTATVVLHVRPQNLRLTHYASDHTEARFVRPSGALDSRTVGWCRTNGFDEVRRGVWAGPWWAEMSREDRGRALALADKQDRAETCPEVPRRDVAMTEADFEEPLVDVEHAVCPECPPDSPGLAELAGLGDLGDALFGIEVGALSGGTMGGEGDGGAAGEEGEGEDGEGEVGEGGDGEDEDGEGGEVLFAGWSCAGLEGEADGGIDGGGAHCAVGNGSAAGDGSAGGVGAGGVGAGGVGGAGCSMAVEDGVTIIGCDDDDLAALIVPDATGPARGPASTTQEDALDPLHCDWDFEELGVVDWRALMSPRDAGVAPGVTPAGAACDCDRWPLAKPNRSSS